uniref:G_PROTEIN_RECEP_F1_2 domain-containing protein n=1 Tax=Steinernema glaseri TaxID=37863 RepID=A0A1I7YKE8_9BILA
MENFTFEALDFDLHTTFESDDFATRHPVVASVFVTSTGFTGFLVNAYILYKIVFHSVFGRLFGWMWIMREVSLLCSNFIDWGIYGPSLALSPLNTKQSLLLFQPALITTVQTAAANLLIASNRCLLIRKPIKFKVVFTPRRTAIMIALSWFLPIVIVLGIFFFPKCPGFKLDGGARITICVILEMCASLLFLYIVFIITLVVDVLAIVHLYRMNKFRKEVLHCHLSSSQRRKQLNLCIMIIMQIVVAVPTTFLQMFFDSLLFDISDTLDGLIVICFNDDLRPWKSKSQKKILRNSSGENISKTMITSVKQSDQSSSKCSSPHLVVCPHPPCHKNYQLLIIVIRYLALYYGEVIVEIKCSLNGPLGFLGSAFPLPVVLFLSRSAFSQSSGGHSLIRG